MQFWKIDNWEVESAYIKVDGRTVWFARFYHIWEGFRQHVCGSNKGDSNERIVNIDFTIPHTGGLAVMEVTTDLNDAIDNESWGVRSINAFSAKCIQNCELCNSNGPNVC